MNTMKSKFYSLLEIRINFTENKFKFIIELENYI
jgi:hypothetical protein